MILNFTIMPPGYEPPAPPDWAQEWMERQADFNSKHPRCIGCGQFVQKCSNICADCYDYPY